MEYDRIKMLRENTGMSARKFAETLDIKYTTYYGYENGTREPNYDTMIKMCEYFGCTADYLLGRVDDPNQYYGETKKSPAPAKAETGEVNAERMMKAFVDAGIMPGGVDLTDEDLRFLRVVFRAIADWFTQRDKGAK